MSNGMTRREFNSPNKTGIGIEKVWVNGKLYQVRTDQEVVCSELVASIISDSNTKLKKANQHVLVEEDNVIEGKQYNL